MRSTCLLSHELHTDFACCTFINSVLLHNEHHTALRSFPTRRSPLPGEQCRVAGEALVVSCFPYLSDSTNIPPILFKWKPLL